MRVLHRSEDVVVVGRMSRGRGSGDGGRRRGWRSRRRDERGEDDTRAGREVVGDVRIERGLEGGTNRFQGGQRCEGRRHTTIEGGRGKLAGERTGMRSSLPGRLPLRMTSQPGSGDPSQIQPGRRPIERGHGVSPTHELDVVELEALAAAGIEVPRLVTGQPSSSSDDCLHIRARNNMS